MKTSNTEKSSNNFAEKVQQNGIFVIMILVFLLLAAGIVSHISISWKISGIACNELHELAHKVVDGSSIAYLTTLIIVFLVYYGVHFLKSTDDRLKKIEDIEKRLNDSKEEIKKLEDRNSDLEKLSKAFALHIPIAYIYTASSTFANKKLTEKSSLMSFFYKINRQINSIEYELKKDTIELDNNVKQMLINDYLEDSINNIENIMSDNKLDWNVARKTLDDLREIKKKIGSVKND